MAGGTLLAVGGSAGAATLTITVATTPAPGEVIWMIFLSENGTNNTPLGITAISDSKGGTWPANTFVYAAIGYIADSGVELGSVIRTAGAALVAGDTITVTWDPSAGFPPAHTAVICHGLRDVTSNLAQKQKLSIGGVCAVEYSNSVSYPSNGGTPSDLLWGVPFYPEPIPCAGTTVAMISAAGGIGGASDWSPVNGSRLADTTQPGGLYLAFCLDRAAADLVTIQPGGSFATPGSITAANYQFLLRPISPKPVFRTHHRAAR